MSPLLTGRLTSVSPSGSRSLPPSSTSPEVLKSITVRSPNVASAPTSAPVSEQSASPRSSRPDATVRPSGTA
jgi:hypothetical protein